MLFDDVAVFRLIEQACSHPADLGHRLPARQRETERHWAGLIYRIFTR